MKKLNITEAGSVAYADPSQQDKDNFVRDLDKALILQLCNCSTLLPRGQVKIYEIVESGDTDIGPDIAGQIRQFPIPPQFILSGNENSEEKIFWVEGRGSPMRDENGRLIVRVHEFYLGMQQPRWDAGEIILEGKKSCRKTGLTLEELVKSLFR